MLKKTSTANIEKWTKNVLVTEYLKVAFLDGTGNNSGILLDK
jgi:hypothetical protein